MAHRRNIQPAHVAPPSSKSYGRAALQATKAPRLRRAGGADSRIIHACASGCPNQAVPLQFRQSRACIRTSARPNRSLKGTRDSKAARPRGEPAYHAPHGLFASLPPAPELVVSRHVRHILARTDLAIALALAVPRVWSAESDQQPSDWPRLPAMSASCEEAQGTYEDPNTWTWERQSPATGEKSNGKRHAAWTVFALPVAAVEPDDTKAGSRTFVLSIDQAQFLSITYKLDGAVVAARSFKKTAWSCTPEGIVVTTIDREGVVLDKVPNVGRAVERAIVRVKDGSLYVQTVRLTKTRVLGVLPQSFRSVSWQTFHPAR